MVLCQLSFLDDEFFCMYMDFELVCCHLNFDLNEF